MTTAIMTTTTRALSAATLFHAVVFSVAATTSAADFQLTAQSRALSTDRRSYERRQLPLSWNAAETAVIVVDMWDFHWCTPAAERTGELAPRINALVTKARSEGALIIHAPSDCMKFYVDHPARRRAQSAPVATNLPPDIKTWCSSILSEREGQYPVDQSDGGCDADPLPPVSLDWTRQHAGIEIRNEDAISDSGVEVWNLLEARGIKNVMLMGVHTNMCVLGRPFGLRNLSRNGKNVVLVRDLTDSLYNPKSWPYVNHFRGTELIVEHIEKYVCPTVTSNQIVGGEAFRFQHHRPPHVVVAASEDLYQTERTLSEFAHRVLEQELGYRVTTLTPRSEDKAVLPGFASVVETADLLILSMRRRAVPSGDMGALKAYLGRGKPVVALRTSSHAFDARGKADAGRTEWIDFDSEVLGCNYEGHHPNGPVATISTAKQASGHPVLRGLDRSFTSQGSLYRSRPLAGSARILLSGEIPGQPAEPVAWTNRAGKARVFYTSLGHPQDFAEPNFVRLLSSAVRWCDEEMPEFMPDDFRSWRSVQVPDSWDAQSNGALAEFDGHAWYRAFVNVPGDWKGPLELRVGRIDDADRTYWNGKLIGSAGDFEGTGEPSGSRSDRKYQVPADAIKPGAWNTIAVHVFDAAGEGGIVAGQPELRHQNQMIRLAGRWELRLGNDDAWAEEAAPADPAQGARFNRIEKVD